MSLQHSDRNSEVLHCVGRRRRESVWTRACWEATRLLRGARRVARLEHSAQGVRWCSDTTDDTAKATGPTPNATIVDDEDRAASAQLCWMMLMICKGAALNTLFLAGDSEGLEAWRELTEKYEPKMRTRFARQLMSILYYSFQGDTTERITAWEREIATYERDSGKILDDEIKVGAVLLRFTESHLKTHLLMRVDRLKKWTDVRDEVAATPRAIAAAQPPPTPMDIGAVGEGKSFKGGKGSKGAGKRNNQIQQACSRCGNTDHTSANCPCSDETCRKCWSFGKYVSILWNSSAEGQGRSERQRRWQGCECCQNLLELW